jgi:3-dehydroquinate synthetase
VDVDDEVERAEGPIWELFAQHGESAFRELEARFVRDAAARKEPSVIAVGGGAVETRHLLRELGALVVHVDLDVDTCWSRVRGSRRPLAQDEAEFRRRYEARRPLYAEAADAVAVDADGVVLAAAAVDVTVGALERLDAYVPSAAAELVADSRVAAIHGPAAQVALAGRLAGVHELPQGEAAKSPAAWWRLVERLSVARDGALVALGGGATTDAAGFAAATHLRGIAWVAVPTTLVGQVDAAIGGKTGIDLPHGKNLVGAFHWPARTMIDPALLATLPAEERLNGMAEVVKTGLLAGEPLWELPDSELVRRCAAYKAAVCLDDPFERGRRTMLNLGHTFAHALESASGHELPHGRAVALGLRAALRLSGVDDNPVEQLLRPRAVRVDRERAWAALLRDKKVADGRVRLVLLDRPGRPRIADDVPEADVRRALDELIAD